MPASTPAPTAKPTPAPTPTPEPVSETEPDHPYKAILDGYYTAFSEGWGISRFTESGLNYMPAMYAGDMLNNVGFYVGDLDGDGREELSIGAMGGDDFVVNMIYEFYTLNADGTEASQQMSSTERQRYYMCEDNSFIFQSSESAARSTTIYYKLEDSGFLFTSAVVYDAAMQDDAFWFSTTDYDLDPDSFEPLTADEATTLTDGHIALITRPAYIPFADYPGYDW